MPKLISLRPMAACVAPYLAATINATAKDADGNTVAGVVIALRDTAGVQIAQQITNDQGVATSFKVPRDRYTAQNDRAAATSAGQALDVSDVTGNLLTNTLGIENPLSTRNALHDRTDQTRGFGHLSYVLHNNTWLGLMARSYAMPVNPTSLLLTRNIRRNKAAMKERRGAMWVAVAIVSFTLLVGYSYDASSANPVLLAFVDRARASLERCDAVALERTGTIVDGANAAYQCANDARRKIEPFYDAAAAAVRMQRGTSMYLRIYHTQWTQHLQRLSDTELLLTGSGSQTLAQDIEQLRMLEEKLVQ